MAQCSPLKRSFSSREELGDYIRHQFAGLVQDSALSPVRGGRRAALERLHQIDPITYARSRNYLGGKVSQLSPYLRHGVLTLAEVRDYALSRVSHPHEAEKFIQELGWRDYFQRLHRLLGKKVWQDLEPYKTGCKASAYSAELPEEVAGGRTGLACIDGFSRQLEETGYLHNHARMWLAAYLVHWRKVRWQTGARWFLKHLLDGDPASNNLSWQWVASTFSQKPYFFNRENLERFSAGQFCRNCLKRQTCPFDQSYDQLEERLFGSGPRRPPVSARRLAPPEQPGPFQSSGSQLFWMHGDGLRQACSAPALFVFDRSVLRQTQISLKRLVFLYECLLELEVDIQVGQAVELVRQRQQRDSLDHVVTTASPAPGFLRLYQKLQLHSKISILDEPAFLREPAEVLDLTRFSRYWHKVQPGALAASISDQSFA